MEQSGRRETLLSLLRGLASAVLLTLAGMAAMVLLVVYGQLGDGLLSALNQALKLGAVFLGAWRAVGPGGSRGFAKGAVIGLSYIALGYGACALWGGMTVSGGLLAAEFLAGALLGGVSGALIANLPARGKYARKRTARA